MINVIATNPDCARAAKRAGAVCIYVPVLNFKRGFAQMAGVTCEQNPAPYPKDVRLILSAVSHNKVGKSLEAKHGINEADICRNHKSDTLLADGLGAVEFARKQNLQFEVGPHIPVLNSLSAQYFGVLGCTKIWLSPELSLLQIKKLISAYKKAAGQGVTNSRFCHAAGPAVTNSRFCHAAGQGVTNYPTACHAEMEFGLTVIGNQELMITEHCELMSQGECTQSCVTCPRRSTPHTLKDRKGYHFPVVTDALGRSHIYNSVQTDNCHAIPDLQNAGINDFAVDSTLMNPEQTAQAVGRLKSALRLAAEGKQIDKPKNTTTGHLFREVT